MWGLNRWGVDHIVHVCMIRPVSNTNPSRRIWKWQTWNPPISLSTTLSTIKKLGHALNSPASARHLALFRCSWSVVPFAKSSWNNHVHRRLSRMAVGSNPHPPRRLQPRQPTRGWRRWNTPEQRMRHSPTQWNTVLPLKSMLPNTPLATKLSGFLPWLLWSCWPLIFLFGDRNDC